jgi:integrase
MATKKFTSRWIDAVKVDVRTDFVDSDTPGLVLRVTPRGTKTWSFMYRRPGDQRRRRVTLEQFPIMGLKEARAVAAGHKEKIAAGADPAGVVHSIKQIETVNELLDRYLSDAPPPSAKWAYEITRIFQKDVRPAIGSLKIDKVKRTAILAILNEIKDRGAGISANRALAAIRRAFSWAVAEGYLQANPALGIALRVKEHARDRALAEAEIRAFWTGLDEAPMPDGTKLALRLALVTGQRIGEVCGALKSEFNVDRAEWQIPASRTKNRKSHFVPLSPLAVELFKQAIAISGESKFVFPSRQRSGCIDPQGIGRSVRGALKILGLGESPATPHDLRRTVASQMAAMGIGENIVARVLNHSSEIGKTITGAVYIRHSFAVEKRHALEAWASELVRITTGEEPKGAILLRSSASR